eukprot:6183653-Pleurochrysis_carterae.AAC.8
MLLPEFSSCSSIIEPTTSLSKRVWPHRRHRAIVKQAEARALAKQEARHARDEALRRALQQACSCWALASACSVETVTVNIAQAVRPRIWTHMLQPQIAVARVSEGKIRRMLSFCSEMILALSPSLS